MKTKMIAFLLCFLGFTNVRAQQNTVTISGHLVNFSNQVMVEDLSEYQYLNAPSTDKLITPDSTNKFSITFKLGKPNYFRIGRNILYLTPGDNLNVVINLDDYTYSTFKGIGAEANTYLADTPFPKAGSYLLAGRNLAETPYQTFKLIMDGAKKRQALLKSVKNISPEFRRLEGARIKADVLNSLDMVKTYAQVKQVPLADEYGRSVNGLAIDVRKEYKQNFVDASFLKLAVYRDLVSSLLDDYTDNADVQEIKDYLKASDMVYRMRQESDKAKLAAYNESIETINTVDYRNALKGFLNGLLQFGKGDTAVDFTALDINGNKVNLSSLKGKVVYVDIWATWCGPCLDEMPKLEELKAKYQSNPNVVFLSLSIDEDNQMDLWKRNVAGRNANGYQWQIGRTKLNAYNITTIPRTLLIGKDFKIASMSAPLPSAKDLSDQINKLLN